MFNIESLLKQRKAINYLLYPLSLLFMGIAWLRRYFYILKKRKRFSAVIVVVGNISLGGNGKTPTLIALGHHLKKEGLKIGVISRGFLAKSNKVPTIVSAHASAKEVGDEPLLIAQSLDAPVVIGKDRVTACEFLLSRFECDVVLSDDGLQHYALRRDIEIICTSQEGMGNGFCLPAGPLREPISRLKTTSFVLSDDVTNNAHTKKSLVVDGITHFKTNKKYPVTFFKNQSITAVTAIAHPERFFATLDKLGLEFTKKTFYDHYCFSIEDFQLETDIILMTQKDAVKCQSFDIDNIYVLNVGVCIPKSFTDRLMKEIKRCRG